MDRNTRFATVKNYTRNEKESAGEGGRTLVKEEAKGESYTTNFVLRRFKKRRMSSTRRNENKSEERRADKYTGRPHVFRSHTVTVRQDCENTRKPTTTMPSITQCVPNCTEKRIREGRLTVTSLCSGCFGEPLAPTAVHFVVTSSAEVLDRLGVEYIRNQQVPSSVVRRIGLAGAGRDKAGGRTCSEGLDVFDGDECEIAAVIHSWSFEVVHRTVRGCSSKGEQGLEWVRWENGETVEGQRDCW